MLIEHLYTLTREEFEVSDLQPLQGPAGGWQVTATHFPSRLQKATALQEVTVGHGATEEQALRELRVRLVAKKFGEARG